MKPVDIGRRRLKAAGPQPVMFVELFFDLVFVFAVTQVTILTAHHLTSDGILRSLLLFWLIWWAWTQFTWTLNPADTTHGAVRVITLVATGAAFIMATAVPRAFEEDALWFAVPYVVVRLLGLALQLKVDNDGPDVDTHGARVWASLSAVGLVLVIAGAVADPTLRVWLWVLVIGADLVAATFAGQTQEESDLDPAHFSERHGLFVIIALGESLIVAGTAMAAEERTGPLVAVAALAVVVACLMWWTYFGWLKEALEHGSSHVSATERGPVSRDVYSLSHFPLVCGIIGFAVAIEEIVLHPDEPAPAAVVAALGVGVALYVGFSAVAYWRLYHRILVTRVVALVGMAGLLVLVAPLAPVWPLAVVVAALTVLVLVERSGPRAGVEQASAA
jgi:low temperature requirement protein LtrA